MALGDIEKKVELEVRSELGGSTVFNQIGKRNVLTRYNVKMTRFDKLFESRQWERPCLCKIDVQGAELTVLRGMGEKIRSLDMLIVEVNLIERLRGCPEVFTVLRFFFENDFVLLDILSLNRRPLDGLAAQADLVLVPSGSPLRADKRWLTMHNHESNPDVR
ncbi:MAG: hypothetical protein B1H11_09425 [Desulfobacteraceae bacterium 4484_190.1]|nr:MAG: hypothetical protein B1H11_09425 [Desulfobacteraceae bacterium 4484_190.1]